MQSAIVSTNLKQKIYSLRGRQIMIDADLAALYLVESKKLNQAVKRNSKRFPEDFMFQLQQEEWMLLIQHYQVPLDNGHGGRRTLPYAFTQEGIAMLSGILQSDRAIEINIEIMRTFVQLHKEKEQKYVLSRRIDQLENQLKAMYSNSSHAPEIEFTPKLVRTFRPTKRLEKGRNFEAMELLLRAVAEHFSLTSKDLKQSIRSKSITLPRHIAMYLIRKNLQCSYKEIGRYFGGKDHTTILHACNKIASLTKTDKWVHDSVLTIQGTLKREEN